MKPDFGIYKAEDTFLSFKINNINTNILYKWYCMENDVGYNTRWTNASQFVKEI